MNRTASIILAAGLLAPLPAHAQAQPADSTRPAPQLTAEQQIAAAVLPAPQEMRAGATVLGYDDQGRLKTLRQGSGPLVCLASNPKAERFHVACYQRSLEPFMARGRAGKLRVPRHPAVLYSLTGPADSFDAATGTAPSAKPLFVVYVPFATG